MKSRTVITFCLALLALWLSAATATAEPILGLEFERPVRSDPTTPLTHSDERAVYLARVKNVASESPAVGAELTCRGTPADGKSWFSADSFAYQWIRNGAEIPGATERTYTTVSADEGKAVQCLVFGTKASTEVVSASGEGTITAGSNLVTGGAPDRAPTPSAGNGDLTAGSKLVTGLDVLAGRFFRVGQTIFATGIPPGTTITAVATDSLELSAAASASAVGRELRAGPEPFAVGQLVIGSQFPPGTTITAVTAQQITVSAAATEDSGGSFATTTNPATLASPTAAVASQPPVVVEPQPGTLPPAPVGLFNDDGRPGIEIRNDGDYFCNTSKIKWSAPPTLTYQWLRDGESIPGATDTDYTPTEADRATKLQCEVKASNAGGSVVVISGDRGIDLFDEPANVFDDTPGVTFSNTLVGADVAVELPESPETYALRVLGPGWNCTKQPPSALAGATASCTRSDELGPGFAYPDIEIVARIGRDAPDLLNAKAMVSGGGAANAPSAEDSFTVGPAIPFGIKLFETKVLDDLGTDYTQAGGHPHSAGALLEFNDHVAAEKTAEAGFRAANGYVHVVRTEIPPGFIGNPGAVEKTCPSISDVARKPSTCPPESIVGGLTVALSQGIYKNLAVYSLEPEYGTPAQFGFAVAATGAAYTLTPELRAKDHYAIDLVTAPVQKFPELFSADVTLCGFGAKSGVHPTREETEFQGCRKKGEFGSSPRPFLTNPTRCSGGPPTTHVLADRWEAPEEYAEASFAAPALTGCDEVEFEPSISLTPTSNRADSPTGLNVELEMPTQGLETPDGIAEANLAAAVVKLPVGMAVNPATASGLGACTPAQIGLGSNAEAACPESSKIGSAEVETPLLDHPIAGSVYVAQQRQNPFDSTLALYLVLSSKRDGVTIKVAGEVAPDPVTGQLTASFEDNPQAPFSRLALSFAGGERAALINPPTCGVHRIVTELSPWTAADPANPTADEVVRSTSSFKLSRGPGGGACPTGALEPGFEAGFTDPTAGAASPFLLRLSRPDGSQRFTGLEVRNPQGLTAYLKGVGTCPLSTLDAISSAELAGAAEVAAPTCPPNSLVGHVQATAGAGSEPFFLDTGRVYLSGPYKGAPISLGIVTPAVAGPFDLGNVVVKTPLYVDPRTAQVRAVSDPIPTIWHGLLLDLREIRVALDRPGFTAAPTSCEPTSVDATVSGSGGGTAIVSDRFQVGGCERLGFKPKLNIRLFGGTKRGDFPRLRATLRARPGDANIASASVALPHSAFLEQGHIRTICTRVQFAADACPRGSIYGHATARTPLLDAPLSGPVYLRSSDNLLPDLVAALRGPDSQPIEIELAGRIDSFNRGIRTTFDVVPDQPVTSFVLSMQGGSKGLLVNSRNLCASKREPRVTAAFGAHNGRRAQLRPPLRSSCKGKKKARSGGHRRG